MFYGREGEIIDGRYRIVRIGVESIVMEYPTARAAGRFPCGDSEGCLSRITTLAESW